MKTPSGEGGAVGKQAVLILGNFRPTLAAARAAARAGHPVYIAAEPGSTGAEHSRFVDKVLAFPDTALGKEPFKKALRDALARYPEIAYLLPMRENVIELLDACRDVVPDGIHLATPPHEAIAVCLDKLAWLEFCRDAGIPCPAFDFASDLPGLKRVVEEIGGEVVIRPVEAGKRIWHRKAITLEGAAEVEAVFPEWPDGLSELVVQKFFQGKRYNIQFAAKDGRVLCGQHSYSIRTDRIDGTGQTIEGRTVAEVPAHSRMLDQAVRGLNYSGLGNAQFLYDPEREEACFLEINPRSGASLAYSEASGLNLTELALQIADPASDPRPPKTWKHVRFVWTYGDLHGLLYSLKAGDLTAVQALGWLFASLRGALLADVHITWSWQDPKPTAVIYAGRLMKAFSAGRKR